MFMRQGVQLIVTIVLARILTPEDFGVVAMLALFTGIASLFVDSGLSAALIQRQNVTPEDESTVYYFNLAAGGVMALLLCALAPWIAAFFEQPILRYLTYSMAFNLFVGAFGSIHSTLLSKAMNFRVLAQVGAVSSALAGLLAIFMASRGYGVWSLAGYILGSGMVTVLLLWRWHPWRPVTAFNMHSFRSLLRFGSYTMAASLTDVISGNLHLILIGKLYSVRDAGLYSRAQNTQQLPISLMMGIVNRVAYSTFSSVADDKERLARGLRKAQSVSMLVNVPLLVGLIILAEPLVLTLFGEQWLPCVPILQVLGLGGLLWPMHALNLNVLMAQGRPDLFFNITVFKKVFTISLTIAASYYGVMAIAWTHVLISIFAYFVNTHYTKKMLAYGGMEQLRDIAMVFAAVIPMAAVIYFMDHALAVAPYIRLIAAGVAGLGVYLLACRLLCNESLNECLTMAGVRKGAGSDKWV